jgi:predicted nucleic acid-binding protein
VEEYLSLPARLFLSCEAVITEVAYFVVKSEIGIAALIDFVEASGLQFPLGYSEHRIGIHRLLRKYSDVPMSFADACLVQLSELYPDAPILTLDSDFLIYRRNRNEHLPLILPPD